MAMMPAKNTRPKRAGDQAYSARESSGKKVKLLPKPVATESFLLLTLIPTPLRPRLFKFQLMTHTFIPLSHLTCLPLQTTIDQKPICINLRYFLYLFSLCTTLNHGRYRIAHLTLNIIIGASRMEQYLARILIYSHLCR